ncbi:MAG: Unknown protein [uncultured Campylobacterales bacterium]|uniref:Uncharacterized protein n=1 Tax=uncultured Campylobacterales bacterium TaxID=352960 RepID=A0A6S6SWE9_9BACT|nr:MAG: Unknown protein [uncultured Campylobacterales bacterium]
MGDRFDKFEKNGRPEKEESEKKTKKILLSMTEKQYAQMQKYQEMFNKNTLTSTIEYLIEKGQEKVFDDLERFRGK